MPSSWLWDHDANPETLYSYIHVSHLHSKPKAKWAGSSHLPEAEFSWRWDSTEGFVGNVRAHLVHLGPSHLSSPNMQNQGTWDLTVHIISDSLTGSPRTAMPLVLIIIEEKIGQHPGLSCLSHCAPCSEHSAWCIGVCFMIRKNKWMNKFSPCSHSLFHIPNSKQVLLKWIGF